MVGCRTVQRRAGDADGDDGYTAVFNERRLAGHVHLVLEQVICFLEFLPLSTLRQTVLLENENPRVFISVFGLTSGLVRHQMIPVLVQMHDSGADW